VIGKVLGAEKKAAWQPFFIAKQLLQPAESMVWF